MKIALYNLTTTTRWGGVENFVWELAAQLSTRGHQVEIFAGKGNIRHAAIEGNHAPRLRLFPYIDRDIWRKIPLLGRQYGLTKLLERLSMAPFALPALLSGGFDIIHIQKPYDLPVGALAKLGKGRPKLIFGCHGKDFWPGDKLFTRFTDASVSASRFNAAQVKAHYNLSPRVVYNGVDLSLFTPTETDDKEVLQRLNLLTPTHSKENTIIYAGRMVRWKGAEYLIKALPQMPPNTQLWLAGEGEYRPTLEKMAEQLGVTEQARFLGKVEQPDLAALYRQSTALVATSFANETFGMALCEAMACGTPVVASNFGGFREVVQHGTTGYLTRPQDPTDLALSVNRLLADPARACEMGLAGRHFVTENFSWEAVAARVEEVYKSVLV